MAFRNLLNGLLSSQHSKIQNPGADLSEGGQQPGSFGFGGYQNAMTQSAQQPSWIGGGMIPEDGYLDANIRLGPNGVANASGGFMRGMSGLSPQMEKMNRLAPQETNWQGMANSALDAFSPAYRKANALYKTGTNLANGNYMGAIDSFTGGLGSAVKNIGQSAGLLGGTSEAASLGNVASGALGGAGIGGAASGAASGAGLGAAGTAAGAAGGAATGAAAAESGGLLDGILALFL